MQRSLTFVFLILLSITVEAAQFIEPGNENIRYTGRWDRSNPSQPWSYAKGTSLIANFYGSGISATFSDTSTDYLRIIIDGAASDSTMRAAGRSRALILREPMAGLRSRPTY
jgi:hypothetical protein